MTRVIHTGDTHIGYHQYNAPERRQDFLEAFGAVVDDAIADDVDAVIHAGDLFHDRRPGLIDLQGTVEILRRLTDADVPFLAVVGNHEGKRDAQWLDLFADLGLATRLGPTPEVVEDVAFYGLDFVPRSRRDDLAYDFDPVPEDVDHAALVSHGLFEPFAHADWDTETVLEEASVGFDAMLLGDNHAADTAEVADTWVTYCGSTERASASERDDRGYNLVSFEESVAISRRSVPDTREFVFVDVELGDGEGIDRIQERVREYDLEDAVVIVTVEGEGRPITPAGVEELAIERGALVARVNDRREIADADEEVSVSFADPDDAVRERVREMGLSNAALEIDRTVRDGEVADTNVRESVERRVRELLESDESAFAPAPERDPEGVTTVADALSNGGDEGGSDEGAASSAEGDKFENASEPDASDGAAAAGDAVDEVEANTGDAPADEPKTDRNDNEPETDIDDSERENSDEGGDSDEPEDAGDAGTTSLGDFA
ncbi:DNA double-strand break repair protein Mre11 [Natrialbaceae archaeon A-CW3]